MRKTLIILGCIVLFVIALPFLLGFCAFRVDSFYHLQGEPKIVAPPITVSFRPIICHDAGQKYSIPGALAPNERANGFQIEWTLGDYNDFKKVLLVKDIKAELIAGGTTKALDVPFSYWPGEYNASKNKCYAFMSIGGYTTELPLGVYRVRLSYIANDIQHADEVTLDYRVERRFGFHTFFKSKWF